MRMLTTSCIVVGLAAIAAASPNTAVQADVAVARSADKTPTKGGNGEHRPQHQGGNGEHRPQHQGGNGEHRPQHQGGNDEDQFRPEHPPHGPAVLLAVAALAACAGFFVGRRRRATEVATYAAVPTSAAKQVEV